VSIDSTDAYLRLRKDNLAIPKEFFRNVHENSADFEFDSYNGGRRHPLVPPLKLPKNAVEDWRHKLLLEK